MQVFFNFFLGAGNDQKARVGSREGSGEVWRVDMKKGGGEGETGRGRLGGNGEGDEGKEDGETGRGRQGGG